ncbi:MAG: hypothetical protein ACE5HU_07830 [Acidobacteriota bacterium]
MTDPVMQLSQSHGDGRITFRALKVAGFDSLADIVATQVQVLADRAHLSRPTAERLKAGAHEMYENDKDQIPPVRSSATQRRRDRQTATQRVAGRTTNRVPAFSEGIKGDEAILLGQGNGRETIEKNRKGSLEPAEAVFREESDRAIPHLGATPAVFGDHLGPAAQEEKMPAEPEPADVASPAGSFSAPNQDTIAAQPKARSVRLGYWSFG